MLQSINERVQKVADGDVVEVEKTNEIAAFAAGERGTEKSNNQTHHWLCGPGMKTRVCRDAIVL